MTFLFLGLLKKMLRQLRQRLGRKMGRDRVVLQLRAELVTDLFVDRVADFLARKIYDTYRGLHRCKRITIDLPPCSSACKKSPAL